jgi:hypothetical protein
VRRGKVWLLTRLERIHFPPDTLLPGVATDFHPHLVQAEKSVIGLLWLAAILALLYLWLVYSLGTFPRAPPGPTNSKNF